MESGSESRSQLSPTLLKTKKRPAAFLQRAKWVFLFLWILFKLLHALVYIIQCASQRFGFVPEHLKLGALVGRSVAPCISRSRGSVYRRASGESKTSAAPGPTTTETTSSTIAETSTKTSSEGATVSRRTISPASSRHRTISSRPCSIKSRHDKPPYILKCFPQRRPCRPLGPGAGVSKLPPSMRRNLPRTRASATVRLAADRILP